MHHFYRIKNALIKLEQHHIVCGLAGIFALVFVFIVGGAQNTLAQTCTTLSAGDLFKVKGNSAVYIVNESGRRMYFPNSEVYHTWYKDFSYVTEIPNICVDNYPSGGGVNYRPGSRLIKSVISPSVYAILPGNTKAKLNTEATAKALYGANWRTLVRDIADVFDANYNVTGSIDGILPHNGQLLRSDGSDTIYYVKDGALNTVIGKLDERTLSDVRTLDAAVLASMQTIGGEFATDTITQDPLQNDSNLGNYTGKQTKGQTDSENTSSKTPSSITEQTAPQGSMTFRVTVPKNTPTEDSIYIYPLNREGVKMTKIVENTYEVILNSKDISLSTDADNKYELHYTYGRDGRNFAAAEYIAPDTSEEYLAKRGRAMAFEDNTTQNDMVTRWRWFPNDTVVLQDTATIQTAESDFTDRIGKVKFRSGQTLATNNVGADADKHTGNAAHMKAAGYNWITIRPTWDWIQTSPLPNAANPNDSVGPTETAYTDEQLHAAIAAYKDAGLRVMIEPQLCCTYIDLTGQSAEWYAAYFDEIEEFLLHYAQIAETKDVDAIVYFAPKVTENEPVGIVSLEQDRMNQLWQKVRLVFSGEVGEGVWAADNSGNTDIVTPSPNYMTWGGKLDFFYVRIDSPVVTDNLVSDATLKNGAVNTFDGAYSLYKYFGKPIWVETNYKAVTKSWKGSPFYEIGKIPTENDSEISWSEHAYSGYDQARVVSAFFNAIQNRTWIIGYNQTGYRTERMPFLGDESIKAREAEEVWKSWNKLIFK